MHVSSTGFSVVIINVESGSSNGLPSDPYPAYNSHAEAVADGLENGDFYTHTAGNSETQNIVSQVKIED